MQKEIELVLSPEEASDELYYKPIIANQLKTSEETISFISILRRSIDARYKNIRVILNLLVYYNEPVPAEAPPVFKGQNVSKKDEVIIVGAGPAGLFSALNLIESGYKPIIVERGKEINKRKKDIAIINKEHIINPDSNYCFGEGGAGAFSDGKLYTRSKKKGDIKKILKLLVFFGAEKNILYETHPHIGSDKLPGIISEIRETILGCGGVIQFSSKVTGFLIKNNQILGVKTSKENIGGKAVILATGHSARDIYEYLYQSGIALEAKPFAMGIRIEHPQKLINSIQYHGENYSKFLPAASYKLVTQVNNRGVYSFCMCPGGFIIPSSSAQQEIVINGMSPANRNSPFANSGIVVEISLDDLHEYKQYGILAGLKFQQHLETLAYNNGGRGQIAPAQRMVDFVKRKLSRSLPESSYQPGIITSPLHFWIPEHIEKRLREGFKYFGKMKKSWFTNEAVLLGIESRTSSPIRIPRENQSGQHIQVKGLFPCGEGSGYTGGIISSALDGDIIAQKLVRWMEN